MEEEGNEFLSRNKEGNLGVTAQKVRLRRLSQERNRAKSMGFISNSGSFRLLLTLNEDQLGSAAETRQSCLTRCRASGPSAAGEQPRSLREAIPWGLGELCKVGGKSIQYNLPNSKIQQVPLR